MGDADAEKIHYYVWFTPVAWLMKYFEYIIKNLMCSVSVHALGGHRRIDYMKNYALR